MNKNAISRKMINQYYEEQAIIAAENAKMVATPAETDPLWDCWYEISFMYEPQCTKDTVQVSATQDMDTEFSDFVDDMFYDESVYEPNSKDKRCKKVSLRRKNTAKHKRNLGKMAGIMDESYRKRCLEDMRNVAFCKKRGGMRVEVPKSLTRQADCIIKRAEKMQRYNSDQQENTTENTVISKVDNTVIEEKAAA